MSWLDDNFDMVLMEDFLYREQVEDYVSDFSDKELMLEAKEVLEEFKPYLQRSLVEKVRSIITFGIVHQRLTDKQRYALGDFIISTS